MSFNDFDIEIADNRESQIEHFNGTLSSIGSWTTITPSTGRPIQLMYISVPGVRDPYSPNARTDVLKYSLDGGTNYDVIISGNSMIIPGNCTNIKIDSNATGTTYRIILWS